MVTLLVDLAAFFLNLLVFVVSAAPVIVWADVVVPHHPPTMAVDFPVWNLSPDKDSNLSA